MNSREPRIPQPKRELAFFVDADLRRIRFEIGSADAKLWCEETLPQFGQWSDTAGHTLYVSALFDFADVVNYVREMYPDGERKIYADETEHLRAENERLRAEIVAFAPVRAALIRAYMTHEYLPQHVIDALVAYNKETRH
jgi:hypothetical protein